MRSLLLQKEKRRWVACLPVSSPRIFCPSLPCAVTQGAIFPSLSSLLAPKEASGEARWKTTGPGEELHHSLSPPSLCCPSCRLALVAAGPAGHAHSSSSLQAPRLWKHRLLPVWRRPFLVSWLPAHCPLPCLCHPSRLLDFSVTGEIHTRQ